jgi:hypothetical protein
MPLYTTPIFGVIVTIFCTVDSSTRTEGSFFSVARTTPSVADIPSDVAPAATAFSAYSICTSFPLGEKVVKEKEYFGKASGTAVSTSGLAKTRSGPISG